MPSFSTPSSKQTEKVPERDQFGGGVAVSPADRVENSSHVAHLSDSLIAANNTPSTAGPTREAVGS